MPACLAGCAAGAAGAPVDAGPDRTAPRQDSGIDTGLFGDVRVALPPDARLGTGDGGAQDAADGAVLVAPTSARDRIGVYAWGFDTTAWPGAPDRLNWAASKVSGLGGRTIRVYLGPQDIYRVLPPGDAGAFDLATAAASPAYATLFANPSFDTYLLTTYSVGDNVDNWSDGFTAAEATTEQQQISSLGTYLLRAYPTKTFILLNWEGDNAIAQYASNGVAYGGFTDWIQARSAGVQAARAGVGGNAKLYSGVELNLLRNLTTGAPCDTASNPCIVSEVVPKVTVDYFSYSSWQSLGAGETPALVAATLQADLTTALGWAKQGTPTATPARFIVGEFGAPREEEDLGECAAMFRTAAVIPAITGWGASYGIFWQVIDNVPSPSTLVLGYGLYKASGPASLSATLFQTLYSTGVPTVPATPNCPTISQGGIVDAINFMSTDIDPTTIISIFGTSFTDAGDIIHVREAAEQWNIDGGPDFYESPTQMNATLPNVGASEPALVYVTDGDGVDSNGQVINVQP